MKSKYSVDDLTLKDDSTDEQIRTREIFLEIRERARRGKSLSVHERNFMGIGLTLSIIDNESVDDYPVLDDYKFKRLYLFYFKDISGGGIYHKHKGQIIYQPNPEEKNRDLSYLRGKAMEWDILVNNNSQPSELLNQAAYEVRKELEILDNLPENKNDPYFKGRFRYRYKRWSVLLQNKYIYCLSHELLKELDPSYFVLNLNGYLVEVTPNTIIHILTRHYSQLTKQYPTSRSFHNEDFKPTYLTVNLQSIFNLIDKAKIHILPASSIYFVYKKRTYTLWISEKTKAVKGKGSVKYLRMDTFYPLEDRNALTRLNAEGGFRAINSELSVYIKA